MSGLQLILWFLLLLLQCLQQRLCLQTPIYCQSSASLFTKKNVLKPKYKADGVSEDNQIVYKHSGCNFLYATMITTTVSVTPVIGVCLWGVYSFWDNLSEVMFDVNQPVLPCSIMSIFGLFLIECIRRVLKPALVRIYYSEEQNKFTAVQTRLFRKRPNIVFSSSDVVWRNPTGIMSEMTGNILVQGKATYVHSKDFRSPAFFNHMMEYANSIAYRRQ